MLSASYWICDRCGAQFPHPNINAHLGFVYRLPNAQLIRLATANGWCNGCATVTVVEHLPTSDEVGAYRALLAPKPKQSFLASVWSRKKTTSDGQLEYELEKARAALRSTDFRASPPKCLTCGSDQIQELTGVRSIAHPGCGGHVTHVYTDVKQHIRPTLGVIHAYDIDCNYLVTASEPLTRTCAASTNRNGNNW
jgi:hypothetical protein